jgi:hypothetical protein
MARKRKSVSSERVAISKRQRFDIFNRDSFTCRYCGKTPPNVLLVVDHIIPISKGGTNDSDNLATSCEQCNQGKSATLVKHESAPENIALAIAQSRMEEERNAMASIAAIAARKKLAEELNKYVYEKTGRNIYNDSHETRLMNLHDEFGIERLMRFIESAGRKGLRDETSIIMYISGCARHAREEDKGEK